jgi:hypothetical protein
VKNLKTPNLQFLSLIIIAGCSFLPAVLPPQQNSILSSTKAIPDRSSHRSTLSANSAQNTLLDKPQKWPYHLDSKRYPITVRYLLPGDLAQAQRVIGYVEHSWQVEIDQLGFPAPIPSDSTGSKRLQIYLQRGADTAVEATRPAKIAGIWWDAWESYLSIDAWGKYGGEILDSTTAHEFNHALHAALDWYESPGFFETSATYIQDKVYPDDNDYLQQIEDFQQHPEWPIHYFDNYKTWYPYGACLYLHFLEHRYFANRKDFLAQIWKDSRNQPRPFDPKTGYPKPESNEPDWIDALEGLLPRGTDYAQTVIEFARWRWYTGRNSDGKHFHEAHLLKPKGEVRLSGEIAINHPSFTSAGPLLLGSEYLKIKRPASGQNLKLAFAGAAQARWVLQLVPGLSPDSDGDNIHTGETVNFGNLPERTLIITSLPPPGQAIDPDLSTGNPLAYQVQIK